MSMLIISPHNNDESLEKKRKREEKKQLLKLRATILYKNKCILMGILLK